MIGFLIVLLSLTTLLSLYRVLLGPTVEDRLVGLNAAASMITAILVLLAVQWGRPCWRRGPPPNLSNRSGRRRGCSRVDALEDRGTLPCVGRHRVVRPHARP